MEISEIGQLKTPAPVDRFKDLSSQDFLKIMFTELTNQDPLNAQDTKELLNQIGSIRSIESNVQLMERLSDLASQSLYAAGGNLIGKHVTGLDEAFIPVQGTIESASIEGDDVVFTLDTGERIPMSHIETISQFHEEQS